VKLYLSRLTDNETSAPPSPTNSKFLGFTASIYLSNGKICFLYSWFQCGALHCYMNTAYTIFLDCKCQLCRCMKVSGAGDKKVEVDGWHHWPNALVRGININRVDISGWYMIVVFGGIGNLFVRTAWMAANRDIISRKTNTLYLQMPNWTDLQYSFHLPSTIITISLDALWTYTGW